MDFNQVGDRRAREGSTDPSVVTSGVPLSRLGVASAHEWRRVRPLVESGSIRCPTNLP
jgi:hypothetical protein